MERTKKAIEGKAQWSDLYSYFRLIEDSLTANPNVAIDGAKSMLESVAKTILENKGIAYSPDSDLNRLVKQAYQSLPEFLVLESRDQQSTLRILSALENIGTGVGALRNNHGFFSHGQDLQADKCSTYLSELAVHSVDLLCSFLISAHSQDHKDRARIAYDDQPEFNEWLDVEYPPVAVVEVTLKSSRTLFDGDTEAYKEKLIEFMETKEQCIQNLEHSGHFRVTHQVIAELDSYVDYLSLKELERIEHAGEINGEIFYIKTDNDVAAFYARISQRKAILSSNL